MCPSGFLRGFITCFILPVMIARRCGPNNACNCSSLSTQFIDINCKETGIELSEVCEYIFDSNFTQLVRLDVSGNNITVLERLGFQRCKNVSTLNLSHNRLKSFSNDIFSCIVNLTELDLSKNRLASMIYSHSKPFLVTLPLLEKLRLNGNFDILTNASAEYPNLSSLTSLKSLTIDGLSNTRFPRSYEELSQLHTLNLSGSFGICNIGKLTEETFKNVKSIKVLDLSQCNISSIDAGTFTVLHALRWLDLSLNRQLGFRVLRNVSYGLQFTQIDYLNYSCTHTTFGMGTQILKRDACFMHNTTLREISLNANRLENFETNVFILLPQTLKTVHVQENKFTFGPYIMQMGCLHNVTSIYANLQNKMHDPTKIYNKEVFNPSEKLTPIEDDCIFMRDEYLKNISSFIPGCKFIKGGPLNFRSYSAPPNIEHFFFANSNLKYQIGRIVVLPTNNRVTHVDLSENVLFSLVGPIGPLPAIKSVNLSMNYCSYIGPDFFKMMPFLETLDLRKNFVGIPLAIDVAGKMFKPLNELKYLILSTNQIKRIPKGALQYLRNLERLDLSFNNIDVFTLSVSDLRNLTHLNLENNAIQTLPDQVIDHFKNLQETRKLNVSINLHDNPIRCSCKNKHFLQWMLKNRENFESFENYTFFNDDGQQIKNSEFINLVNNFDKMCRSYTVLIIVCTLSISIFLSIVLGGFVYKNRWKLRYYLYMNKKKFYGYIQLPNEDHIENFKYDAFISYADNHIQFILREIIPNLEERGLNLCIHQRDFLPGNAIADNIINAIQSSKKTVVLLSKSFLKRKWCLYEFHMARMESIYSRNDGGCLIVVLLEQVATEDMPLEMVQWIKEESYIEFTNDIEGNQLFWSKLTDAIKNDLP